MTSILLVAQPILERLSATRDRWVRGTQHAYRSTTRLQRPLQQRPVMAFAPRSHADHTKMQPVSSLVACGVPAPTRCARLHPSRFGAFAAIGLICPRRE